MAETKETPQKEEQKKLTYEQLEQLAGNLSKQNEQLYNKVMEQNFQNIITRLGLLFKVIENSDKFNPEFVVMCSEEIEKTITLPKEEEKKEE